MESQVTVNWSAVGPDLLQYCYKKDSFHNKLTTIPFIICVLLNIFLVLLSVITICGNLLVIISIIYFKQLHTPTNYLIVSMATADLLIGIIVCPISTAIYPSSCMYSEESICNIRGSFDISLTQCSILHLGCISIDRYYAVCQPLTYRTKITDRVVVVMILVTWGLSALIGINIILFLETRNDSSMKSSVVLALILSLVSFFLPVIIMICISCLYLKIFIVAQRQVRSIHNTTSQSTKSGATVSKMERKSTKTLAIVLGFFLLCWIPYFLCNVTYLFDTSVYIPEQVNETMNWFKLSNSMLNPFIYAFFYRWFRTAFKMILSGKIFQGDFTNSQLH